MSAVIIRSEAEIFLGLFIKLLFTGFIWYVVSAGSPGQYDLVLYLSWMFFAISLFSFAVDDEIIIEVDGNRWVNGASWMLLLIQVAVLADHGLVFIAFLRSVTEIMAAARIVHAKQGLKRRYAFTIDQDDSGHTFIEHHRCERRSYNANDIEHQYCGYCHEFLKDRR